MPDQIKSWSYSRYGTYAQCPLKAKLTILDKLPEPKGPAMERGAAIHESAERYLKGLITRLPKELSRFGPQLKALRSAHKKNPASVVIEDMWGFTDAWESCRWDDWARCWFRVKLDCLDLSTPGVVRLIDFKTGSYRPDNQLEYLQQLELYALAVLLKTPLTDGAVVSPELWYLDAGVVHAPERFTAQDLPRLKKEWKQRVHPMLKDRSFLPKPNRWCGWCHFRKSNDGPCPL